MTAPQAQPNPRLHVGGKLSSRGRVRGLVRRESRYAVFGGEDPPPLGELVPEGYSKVELEIGPGKGAFLLAATEMRPDTFLLGVEAAPAYALLAAQRLEAAGRSNGLLLVDHGKLYLQDRVPDSSLDRLHVYFPDPWPKRRHRKRRFFTEEIPRTLVRVLKPGGWCLVATDNAAYAGQICRVVGSCRGLGRDRDEEQRLAGLPPGHGFSPTNFQRKYEKVGRVIRRYAFQHLPGSLPHP